MNVAETGVRATLLICSTLALCAVLAAEPVEVGDYTHVRGADGFAAIACAEMGIRGLGGELDQADVFAAAGVDPTSGRGCRPNELTAALEKLGLRRPNASLRLPLEGAPQAWAALKRDLDAGVPSIVWTGHAPEGVGRCLLAVGIDDEAAELIVLDPARTSGEPQRVGRDDLLAWWSETLTDSIVLLTRHRLEPGELREPSPRGSFTALDFAQHCRALRDTHDLSDFELQVESPFVVAGDLPRSRLLRWSTGTVAWAVRLLRQAYFHRDPGHIITVWLFEGDESYREHALEFYGDEPSTPYGYYSPSDRALVMNISTGGGTLVHEIVHPYVAANFPACPSWFNEGLGSLYEQCREVDGKIMGLTNWRLAGLQEAISDGSIGSFERLCSTSSFAFYNRDRGTNYSQSRYLLYYLQEKGLLRRFYRAFVDAQEDDPTGYETLQKILGEDDMAAFQERWQEYVLALEYR